MTVFFLAKKQTEWKAYMKGSQELLFSKALPANLVLHRPDNSAYSTWLFQRILVQCVELGKFLEGYSTMGIPHSFECAMPFQNGVHSEQGRGFNVEAGRQPFCGL